MDDSQDRAWGSLLMDPEQKPNEFVIPKTLGEALIKDKPLTIIVNRTEIVEDLKALKEFANESFAIVSQFSGLHHNLGLALNKLSSIVNKTSQLIKKYE